MSYLQLETQEQLLAFLEEINIPNPKEKLPNPLTFAGIPISIGILLHILENTSIEDFKFSTRGGTARPQKKYRKTLEKIDKRYLQRYYQNTIQ